MAGSLSERATSDMLIGPDWAMNIEICDILNHDPGQSKDAVRVIKRRIGHKNPKIQLLALTLLETIVKNCGDIVHMHVAEKDVLHKMVKIVKKKPDSHVKEKILILIDTWQEVFGGPRARYPQYYAAYQELLRAGAVFPQRPERSAPVLTPPQTQPLSSYPPSLRNPDYQQEAPEASDVTDLPSLSLSDIQNARGIVDVLAEMLSAIDPGNREALKQEVIVDLVGQCRGYRQRVVQLVNTTSDEELLEQGLSLNDELQRVLAKHDAFAAGIPVREDKPKTLQALVDVDDSTARQEPNQRSSTSTNTNTGNQAPLEQLLLTGPLESNNTTNSLALIDPNIDLLSGADFSKPSNENSLALVPVGEPLANSNSASDQNILALSDMFPGNNTNTSNNGASTYDVLTDFSAPPKIPTSQIQVPNQQLQQSDPFSNGGGITNSGPLQYNQTTYGQGAQPNQSNASWNGQAAPGLSPQQVQAYGSEDQGGALPPPPWETQLDQNAGMLGMQPQTAPNSQLGGMHSLPGPNGQLGNMQQLPGGFVGAMQPPQFAGQQPHLAQNSSYMGMYPQMQNPQMAALYSQQMLGAQMPGMHQQAFQGPTAGYGYGQQPEAQYYDPRVSAYPYSNPNELAQRMHGLSMRGNNSSLASSSSYQVPMNAPMQQSNRPAKPEDKLFGDLLSIAKTKQSKPTSSKNGPL